MGKEKVLEAMELAEKYGILDRADIKIDLTLDDLKDGDAVYRIYVGTAGRDKTYYLSGRDTIEFMEWATGKGKREGKKEGIPYAISFEDEVVFEIIMRDVITGIKVEIDEQSVGR